MEKKEEWIEETKKEIRMEGKSCENCSKGISPLGFPMIFSEEESRGKKVVFNCSVCKLKAVGRIFPKKTNPFYFYVTKNQKLII